MMTLSATLTDLCEATAASLVATLPGAIDSPEGQELMKRMATEVASYFSALEEHLPISAISTLISREIVASDVKPTDRALILSWRAKIEALLAPAVAKASPRLFGIIAEMVSRAYLVGATQSEDALQAQVREAELIAGIMDLPIPEEITSWARAYSSFRVVGIDETTRQQLAITIADAMQGESRGVGAVAQAIKGRFGNFSVHRANMIAHTEMGNAMSLGARERAESLGSQQKEWIAVGDERTSEECMTNMAQGRIPVGQSFSSGHDQPLAHPLCRCAVAYTGATRASVTRGASPQGRQSWLTGVAKSATAKVIASTVKAGL